MRALRGQEAFFVTGTDTGIGKTVVAAALMAVLQGTYWKPIQSGLEHEMTDTEWIQHNTGLCGEHFLKESYLLNAPCSPHLAAELDEVAIELEKISLPEYVGKKPLLVEGAGGILVPLNREHFILDLIRKLDLPVLLVASNKLGSINHTLLSLYRLRSAGLEVMGVILNGVGDQENKKAIEKYGQTKVLAETGLISSMSQETLTEMGLEIADQLQ